MLWLKDDEEVDPSSLPDPDTLIVEIVDELNAAAFELTAAASPGTFDLALENGQPNVDLDPGKARLRGELGRSSAVIMPG
jgi:hypothetical protein